MSKRLNIIMKDENQKDIEVIQNYFKDRVAREATTTDAIKYALRLTANFIQGATVLANSTGTIYTTNNTGNDLPF